MLVVFMEMHLISSFSTSFSRFSEFDAANIISLEIKVSGKYIKRMR